MKPNDTSTGRRLIRTDSLSSDNISSSPSGQRSHINRWADNANQEGGHPRLIHTAAEEKRPRSVGLRLLGLKLALHTPPKLRGRGQTPGVHYGWRCGSSTSSRTSSGRLIRKENERLSFFKNFSFIALSFLPICFPQG